MRLFELASFDHHEQLYVSRNLLNVEEFRDWAMSQGFTDVPETFHVTIAFSRKKVRWNDTDVSDEPLTVEDGARRIRKFGSATVLCFSSEELSERWQNLMDMGASYDYEDYHSHVTITYDETEVDISKIKPFNGDLEFGPEIFAKLDLDWKSKLDKE